MMVPPPSLTNPVRLTMSFGSAIGLAAAMACSSADAPERKAEHQPPQPSPQEPSTAEPDTRSWTYERLATRRLKTMDEWLEATGFELSPPQLELHDSGLPVLGVVPAEMLPVRHRSGLIELGATAHALFVEKTSRPGLTRSQRFVAEWEAGLFDPTRLRSLRDAQAFLASQDPGRRDAQLDEQIKRMESTLSDRHPDGGTVDGPPGGGDSSGTDGPGNDDPTEPGIEDPPAGERATCVIECNQIYTPPREDRSARRPSRIIHTFIKNYRDQTNGNRLHCVDSQDGGKRGYCSNKTISTPADFAEDHDSATLTLNCKPANPALCEDWWVTIPSHLEGSSHATKNIGNAGPCWENGDNSSVVGHAAAWGQMSVTPSRDCVGYERSTSDERHAVLEFFRDGYAGTKQECSSESTSKAGLDLRADIKYDVVTHNGATDADARKQGNGVDTGQSGQLQLSSDMKAAIGGTGNFEYVARCTETSISEKDIAPPQDATVTVGPGQLAHQFYDDGEKFCQQVSMHVGLRAVFRATVGVQDDFCDLAAYPAHARAEGSLRLLVAPSIAASELETSCRAGGGRMPCRVDLGTYDKEDGVLTPRH